MVNPIQGSQNICTQGVITVIASQKQSAPLQRLDTLRMKTAEAEPFSLIAIWQAIVDCFSSILNYFFKNNEPTPQKISTIATRDHFIWFYKQKENPLTAFLGNFHPCNIQLWGMRFKCAEAAFQAAKFAPDRSIMQRFENLDGEASFQLGRQLSNTWTQAQTNAWRTRNLIVMREIVTAKFNQNADLKALLLASSDSYLVEHTPVKGRDTYWGDDMDGTGQNWLGKICMQVRATLGGSGEQQIPTEYHQFLTSGR